MGEFEDLICTFKAQSYGEGSLICETGICMRCGKGEWHAGVLQSPYTIDPAGQNAS